MWRRNLYLFSIYTKVTTKAAYGLSVRNSAIVNKILIGKVRIRGSTVIQSECISALMVIAYFNFSSQNFEHDESGFLCKTFFKNSDRFLNSWISRRLQLNFDLHQTVVYLSASMKKNELHIYVETL